MLHKCLVVFRRKMTGAGLGRSAGRARLRGCAGRVVQV